MKRKMNVVLGATNFTLREAKLNVKYYSVKLHASGSGEVTIDLKAQLFLLNEKGGYIDRTQTHSIKLLLL